MATTSIPRQTAEARREQILEVADELFAARGYHATSTDDIARAAGISQPYLFRLFGTKKELYLAVVEACYESALEMFRDASAGLEGEAALKAIGKTYRELIAREPRRLQAQMQAYAACDDPEVRQIVQRGYGRLVDYVRGLCDSPEQVARFFATGMLLNVIASMGVERSRARWAASLLEGIGK